MSVFVCLSMCIVCCLSASVSPELHVTRPIFTELFVKMTSSIKTGST